MIINLIKLESHTTKLKLHSVNLDCSGVPATTGLAINSVLIRRLGLDINAPLYSVKYYSTSPSHYKEDDKSKDKNVKFKKLVEDVPSLLVSQPTKEVSSLDRNYDHSSEHSPRSSELGYNKNNKNVLDLEPNDEGKRASISTDTIVEANSKIKRLAESESELELNKMKELVIPSNSSNSLDLFTRVETPQDFSSPDKSTFSEESDNHFYDSDESLSLFAKELAVRLDIIQETQEVASFAEESFKGQTFLKTSPIAPTEDLKHVRSSLRPDASTMMNSNMNFHVGLFEGMYHDVLNSHVDLIRKFEPLDHLKIKDLDNTLLSSPIVSAMPMSACRPYADSIMANGVLGSAQGLQDLIPFSSDHFDGCFIKFKYDNSLSSAQRMVTITLTKNLAVDREKTFVFSDSSTPRHQLNSDFQLSPNHSCFTTGTYKNIMSQIYTVKSSDPTFELSTASAIERRFIVTNDGSEKTKFSDGFISDSSYDAGFKFSVREKCIIDMVSFIMSGDYDIADMAKLDPLVRYMTTIVQHYFISQMVISQGVTLKKLEFELSVEKNVNDPDKLHNIYRNAVQCGDVIPMSPVQFMYYFDKSKIKDWRKHIYAAGMLNVNQNPDMKTVMPKITSKSRTNFHSYARVRKLLNSNTYNNYDKFSPFYRSEPKIISFDDFLMELMVRQASLESIDNCYPMISRSQWKTQLKSSLDVSPASINHQFVKFNVPNITNVITDFNSAMMDIKDSPHVSMMARKMDRVSDIFKTTLMSLDSDYLVSRNNKNEIEPKSKIIWKNT